MTKISATELDLAEMPDTAVSTPYAEWINWCDGRTMPPWSCVDMMSIPPQLLPHTTVVDVIAQPLDFVYRFWGTGLVNLHSKEMTGLSVSELVPAEVAQVARQGFVKVTERAVPVLFVHKYSDGEGSLLTDFIIRLPISDDGKQVTKILSVIESVGQTQTKLDTLLGYSCGSPVDSS